MRGAQAAARTPGGTPKPRPRRGFVVFKWLVYAVLAGNVALYARHGTPNETLDTAAWVVLLLLFEWETGGWTLGPARRLAAHALRALAAVAVAWACAGYAIAREWLDFANALAWLGVVLALELDVRLPSRWVFAHRVRRGVALLLYAALGAFALAWLAMGIRDGEAAAWLDAWDALLWLLAFVVIELNVFGRGRPRAARQPPAAR